MNDIMFRALVGVCFLLALFGLCAITRPHREPKRNVRRESGNTVPRRPNMRRPNRDAEIRALIDFPMREPCWADDEVTKVGGAA